MHIVARTVLLAAGVVGSVGAASAADMTGAEIKAFLSDKTAYLETTASSAGGVAGQVVIYWSANGTALYRTPSGSIMHGTWEVKGDTNCTAWKERPGTGCVRYDKAGDIVTVIDVDSKTVRAKIVKTAAGNVEKLAP